MNTVDHVLYESLLRSAQSPLVGYVEYAITGFSVFAMDAANLNVILVGNLVHSYLVSLEFWQLNMHRCSERRPKIRWA